MCFDTCFRRAGAWWGPPPRPDKVGAVTKCRAGVGNTSEVCLVLPNSFYLFVLLVQSLGKIDKGMKAIQHPFKNSPCFKLGLLHSCCWGLWHEGHVFLCVFLHSRVVQTNHWKKTFAKKCYCWPNFVTDCVAVACFLGLPLGNKKEISIFEWFRWKWSLQYCLWQENCPCQDSGYPRLYRNQFSMAKGCCSSRPGRRWWLVLVL